VGRVRPVHTAGRSCRGRRFRGSSSRFPPAALTRRSNRVPLGAPAGINPSTWTTARRRTRARPRVCVRQTPAASARSPLPHLVHHPTPQERRTIAGPGALQPHHDPVAADQHVPVIPQLGHRADRPAQELRPVIGRRRRHDQVGFLTSSAQPISDSSPTSNKHIRRIDMKCPCEDSG